jgi:hypothetical protein
MNGWQHSKKYCWMNSADVQESTVILAEKTADSKHDIGKALPTGQQLQLLQ